MTETLIVVGLAALAIAGFLVALPLGFAAIGSSSLAVAFARLRRSGK